MTKILSACALLSIDNYNTEITITQISARTEGALAMRGSPKSLKDSQEVLCMSS